jgi:hypothetical protein
MELSPCWEAASRSATQEYPNTLWNHNVLYRSHKSLLLDLILSQMDSVHTTPAYFSKIHASHVSLDLPSGLFLSGFPTNILYPYLFPPA